MTHHSALQRFRDLFSQGPEFASRLLSQKFVNYHVDLFKLGVPFDVYIEKAKNIRGRLGRSNLVLDLGAGFGIMSALLRILGIPRVVALDYHSSKPREVLKLWDYLGLDGLMVLHGDGTNLPFDASSFDGVIALAVLSHIREPDRALGEIARILHPQGRLYVFEDNNNLYPTYERGMKPIWDGADQGTYQDGAAEVKRVVRPYVEFRKDYIRDHFPDLPEEQVTRYAQMTRGMYREQIDRAVKSYLNGRPIRNPFHKIARHPTSGEYEENPINPHIVRRLLEKWGFTSRIRSGVHPPYRGKRGILKWFISRSFQLFPAVIPWAWPTYVVTGILKKQTEITP